jgi:NADH pyrophosphatase NudC (nudix superfamily)
MFGLVAGFVDPGEDLEHALVRDLLEETGITVNEYPLFRERALALPDLAHDRVYYRFCW